MSCGPSKAMRDLADQIDAFDDKIDSLITESPLGKLNDLKNQAGDAVNGVMGKLESAIPEALNKITDFMDKTLHEDVSDLAKLGLIYYVNRDYYEQQLKAIKGKWSGVDLGDYNSLDEIADALRRGALDIESICKMIPNTEKDGVNVVVKGTPTSIPDIDPVALIKHGAIPKIPPGSITIDVVGRAKKQSEEFLNLELPEFDW